MARCEKCRLHKTCQSVMIDGRGAEAPEVVFVGQAPGKEEDMRDKCFVGPAGQLLTQAISEYTLKPAYITNLVKCFPPGDRDPKADEIEACKPYLLKELSKKKPKIVVLLGNIPMKALLGKVGIMNYSGRVIKKDGIKYFPLLHPSFILRYPHNQAQFENHLKELKRELRGEVKEELPVSRVSIKEARVICKKWQDENIAFDFETTGITDTSVGKVRCIALSNGESAVWINAEDTGFEGFARDFLTSPVAKTAHGSMFERRCSHENYGVYPVSLKWDTLAMHYLLDENTNHGLKILAGKFLNAPEYDIYPEMVASGKTYADFDIEKVGKYCAIDALYTARLRNIFWKQIKADERILKVYKEIMLPLIRVAAKMEVNGAFLDIKWAKTVDEKFGKEMEKHRVDFFQHAGKAIKKVGLGKDVNMNSATQIRKIFCTGLDLVIFEKTGGGKESVKESVVEKLVGKHPAVKPYLDWKQLQTKRNNFLQKYPRFADEKSCIHASINPCFVVTGRLSVTKPPLQAVDVHPAVRGMFASRFTGGSIASCDFRQLEVRLVASESNETNLLDAIKRGDDLHDFTASLLFGKNFTKPDRNEAKRINFGVVYGITEYALALQINKSEKYAKSLIENFFDKYPRIQKWMKMQKDFVVTNGYIDSRFGRRRHLGDTSNMPDWQKAGIIRQAGNFPIQSMGADMTNISLKYLFHWFEEKKLKSVIFLQVHDSILVDVFPGEEKEVEKAMVHVMAKIVPALCPWLRTPIEVDFELEKRWGGMKWKDL